MIQNIYTSIRYYLGIHTFATTLAINMINEDMGWIGNGTRRKVERIRPALEQADSSC